MHGVVEVADVDDPHGDADQGDHLGQLLPKLIQLLLQGGSLLLGRHHLVTDFPDFSVDSCCNNHPHGLASSNVCTLR